MPSRARSESFRGQPLETSWIRREAQYVSVFDRRPFRLEPVTINGEAICCFHLVLHWKSPDLPRR